MSRVQLVFICAVLALLPAAIVFSQQLAPRNDLFTKLRHGGYVIVLRHATTSPDSANEYSMRDSLGRALPAEPQLSPQGRAQADTIGAALRDLGISVSLVMTSPRQQAVQTGTLLGFGKVSANVDLGEPLSQDEGERRAAALQRLVDWHLAADGNLNIVTHKANLVDAFGGEWADVREGEASVFEPNFTGAGYRLIARIRADRWSELVEAPEGTGQDVGGAPKVFSQHFD